MATTKKSDGTNTTKSTSSSLQETEKKLAQAFTAPVVAAGAGVAPVVIQKESPKKPIAKKEVKKVVSIASAPKKEEAKAAPKKKPAAKKAAPKPAAKKTPAKKVAVKKAAPKPTAKKPVAKKAAPKAAVKKATAKKAPAKKVIAKKTAPKKTIAKSTTAKTSLKTAKFDTANVEKALNQLNQATEILATEFNQSSEAFKEASQNFMDYANQNFARNLQAAKAALKAKNLNQIFELQNELIKQNAESAAKQVAKTGKLASDHLSISMKSASSNIDKLSN